MIFAVISSGKYLAPRFVKLHPDIQVKLVIGNREEIVRGLEQSRYDLVVMARPPADITVISAVLSDHPNVLIAPPNHPLIGDPDMIEDLSRERFLAREIGSGPRDLLCQFLERIGGGRTFDVIEMGANETIKQAVVVGLGLAVISAHTCFMELQEGKLATLRLVGLPLVRQWRLIHRGNRRMTPASELFRAFMLRNSHALFPQLAELKI